MEDEAEYAGNTEIIKRPSGFLKGEGGRPKGALNKITAKIQERIEWVLEVLDENLEEDISRLKAKDRVELWLDLQEYIRPKLQRVNLELGADDKTINKIIFEVVKSGDPKENGEENQGISCIH